MAHWMGAGRVLVRTRQARRDQDAGAALRALARGANTGVGLRIKGARILLLLDPALAGPLLTDHAGDTVKGPGVQMTRALLGNGLLTSEGDEHRRARRLVAPAFSPGRLTGYIATFSQCAESYAASWQDGEQVDIHPEMAALTLQIVGRTLLGIDLAEQGPRVRAGLESALDQFSGTVFTLPGLRRGNRGATAIPVGRDTAQVAVHDVVDEIIAARRANRTDDRGDVVSALLTASAGPDGLSAEEVHDHVITLLMAGHETTANSLAWALYLLGRHPDVQRRLHEELDGRTGPPLSLEDLAALSYTRAVISEAIRLYPPAWIIGRTITSDIELGGWQLPAGSVAAVSPLLLHTDARWFPEPDVFDPERWLDERRDAVPRNAYLPFGTGPRACIGEQFAWAESTAVLAALARSWSFETDPAHRAAVQYRVTLRPAGPLPVRVRARG